MANINTPEKLKESWPNFGDSTVEYTTATEGTTGSIAAAVVEYFGLSLESSSTNIGGNLTGLDIKHMDALEIIKLSLLEASCENDSLSGLYEVSVNGEGEIKFINIGSSTSTFSSEIYYQVQTASFVEDCKGVLITGGKPMPIRKDLEWKAVWGDTKKIYDVSAMVTKCTMPNYSTHAIIAFRNPHIDNGESQYNDGITNLYEITDPFESIIGYAKYINIPGQTPLTNINYSKDSTTIPILVGNSNPNMGILQVIESTNADSSIWGATCWTDNPSVGDPESVGIKIDIPEEFRFEDIRKEKIDNFVDVSEVVIIGYEIDAFNVAISSSYAATATPTDDNTTCVLRIHNAAENAYKLEEGKHYIIKYASSGDYEDPYIIFAKGCFPNDPKLYGKDTLYAFDSTTPFGILHGSEERRGAILPIAGNKGYLIEEIWAMVKLNTPCISIRDPHQQINPSISSAYQMAENLEYLVTPILLYDPPAPISFNGSAVNQTDGVVDKDPTTPQDFTDTELELVMDQMDGGGGISLNLSFITDPEKLDNLSLNIFNYMNSGSGVETTYVCGPKAEPELGAQGYAGGVINSISYSYSDSSSYTISVNEGPKLIGGLGNCSLAASLKTTESLDARGTIISDLGNHIYYKVKIDSFGDRIAINTAPTILRVGDIVNCSIHNVPVEV